MASSAAGRRLAPPLLLLLFVVIYFPAPASPAAPILDPSEMGALKEIARKLGKTNWNFSVDPCSGEGNWKAVDSDEGIQSGVDCDCTFANGSHCYITNMTLNGQNLTGELPPEFGLLRHLRKLDLSRNLISGSVPKEWSNMSLDFLSLMGNRLLGPFPEALTRITTLTALSIESNGFSGSIPSEIARLVNLEEIVLSDNEFSGELPPAIGTLTNMTDLRICSNNFTGNIPHFIAKLTRLQRLHIQGCPLEGPIPPSFSALTILTDLRISDLKAGIESDIPDLSKMGSLSCTDYKTLCL